MKTLLLGVSFALLFTVVVEAMFSYLEKLLGIDPQWHWLVLLIATIVALSGIVWSLLGLSRKPEGEESTGIIDGGKEKGYKSLEPSRFKRIIIWLRNH